MSKLIIITGPVASGKTRRAMQWRDEAPESRLVIDEGRLDVALEYLRSGYDVALTVFVPEGVTVELEESAFDPGYVTA